MTITHATLAADGTIPLPDEFRRLAGLKPGDVLVVECDGDSLLVRRREPHEPDGLVAAR